MSISSRTPEGLPNRCPVCGVDLIIDPSIPPGDAPCPNCGSLLWFKADQQQIRDPLAAELSFFDFKVVAPNLTTKNKSDALRLSIKNLVVTGQIESTSEGAIVNALLRREELGSTGIGRGVAVPHATHPAIKHTIGVIARSDEGIDFGSADGEPVHTLVVLLSPPDRPGDHLRVLESVSRFLRRQ